MSDVKRVEKRTRATLSLPWQDSLPVLHLPQTHLHSYWYRCRTGAPAKVHRLALPCCAGTTRAPDFSSFGGSFRSAFAFFMSQSDFIGCLIRTH